MDCLVLLFSMKYLKISTFLRKHDSGGPRIFSIKSIWNSTHLSSIVNYHTIKGKKRICPFKNIQTIGRSIEKTWSKPERTQWQLHAESITKNGIRTKTTIKTRLGCPKKYFEYVVGASTSFFTIKKNLHVSWNVVFIGLVQLMASNVVLGTNSTIINY